MKKLWLLPLMLVLFIACDKDDDDDSLVQLAAPTLQSPANNAVLEAASFSFTFSWSEVLNADEYELQIANNNNFTNAFSLSVLTSGIQITSNDIVPGENYFWRVRASGEGFQTSVFSETRTFVYTEGSGGGGGGGGTEVPTLLTPEDNATVNTHSPTFTFTEVDLQAPFYLLQVAADLGFANVIRTYQPTSGTYTVPNASGAPGTVPSIPLGTYFWRVSADNGDTFSDFFTITIE